MRHVTLIAAQVFVVLVLSQRPAAAQVEVGVSGSRLGVVSFEGAGGIAGAGVRVTAPITPRFAVEGYLDVMNVDRWSVNGLYGLQIKQRIIRMSKANTSVFATYGTMGGFSHSRPYEYRYRLTSGAEEIYRREANTWGTPPIVPMIGIGVQQPVARHLAVRLDGQALVAPPFGMGGRLSFGVSVPFGRYAR